MRFYPSFLIILLLFSNTPAVLAQDCQSQRAQGIQIANQVEEIVQSYDGQAKTYNLATRKAHSASVIKADIPDEWANVVIARDALRAASEQAINALGKMDVFNRAFFAAGCFESSAEDIERDYQTSLLPFQNTIQKLEQVPDVWQQKDQTNTQICDALTQQGKMANKTAAEWANKYDDLIAAYDKKYQAFLAMSKEDENYDRFYLELRGARDAALPGVRKYGEILAPLFENKIKQKDAGCITMSSDKAAAYQKQNQAILDEIKTKQIEMQNLEDDFASEPQKTEETKPEPIAPQANMHLQNQSPFVLCLFDPQTKEMGCNFKPGTAKEQNANSLIVFGGGYWSKGGKYEQMKLCHSLQPSNDVQMIKRGIDAGCTAPTAQ